MNTATECSGPSGPVLLSFLLPHPFLDLAANGDSAEVSSAKERRNRAWLLRWLPVYLRRWGLILGFFWLLSTLATSLEFPPLLLSALEFAQCASALAIGWLASLYVPTRS